MAQLEQTSKLIGDIYDAALDPALWTSVLEQIAHFVGGTAAALYAKDTVRKTGNFFRMFGVETEFVRSYFDKYARLDPFTASRFFFPVEQVISTKDIMPHEVSGRRPSSRNGQNRKAGSISYLPHSKSPR